MNNNQELIDVVLNLKELVNQKTKLINTYNDQSIKGHNLKDITLRECYDGEILEAYCKTHNRFYYWTDNDSNTTIARELIKSSKH